jgi:hypothetical protein
MGGERLAMVDQYIGNLKRLRAIAFDAGDKDTGIAATIKTMPFFSKNLVFTGKYD